MMTISKASVHDLPVEKEMLADIQNIRFFGDTAFADKDWQIRMFRDNHVEILTPVKRNKGHVKLSFWDAIYSAAISSIRQVIESFNNWIQQKTNIQNASKVRSYNGLISFIFARIACAFFWV